LTGFGGVLRTGRADANFIAPVNTMVTSRRGDGAPGGRINNIFKAQS
jgi:hypothetical protein